jgi:hypothetical protein
MATLTTQIRALLTKGRDAWNQPSIDPLLMFSPLIMTVILLAAQQRLFALATFLIGVGLFRFAVILRSAAKAEVKDKASITGKAFRSRKFWLRLALVPLTIAGGFVSLWLGGALLIASLALVFAKDYRAKAEGLLVGTLIATGVIHSLLAVALMLVWVFRDVLAKATGIDLEKQFQNFLVAIAPAPLSETHALTDGGITTVIEERAPAEKRID